MKKRKIVNIVNFIRGIEPRNNRDLFEPVREQVALMNALGLRGTFLLQYDALMRSDFVELLLSLNKEQFEFGLWYEIVEPQVNSCGIEWRGRFPWDWHTHCGFPVGYTLSEREALADSAFEKFKEVFGYYPRVFGSWFFDTHTIRYLDEKYGLDAICNCKDQYGTDGYTLWCGYYGQGYYPSRHNVFIPAASQDTQINVPLFRMLGTDPVYQYDFMIDPNREDLTPQSVITLEPACNVYGGGSDPKWVDWFMNYCMNDECLTFSYAQAGQENSFGWSNMKLGIEYQFRLFKKLSDSGKITVEPLGETGRRYKETYKITPASTIVAHSAFDDPEKNSFWYSSRYYRINLYAEKGRLRIRDLHVFSDTYPDPYDTEICRENHAEYESLPVIEGNFSTGCGTVAGGYLLRRDGSEIKVDEPVFNELPDGSARLDYGKVIFEFRDTGITVLSENDFVIENRIGLITDRLPTVLSFSDREIILSRKGAEYSLKLSHGSFLDESRVCSDNGRVKISLA